MKISIFLAAMLALTSVAAFPKSPKTKPLKTHLSMVGSGWSGTSVNTAVFRTNSVQFRTATRNMCPITMRTVS